MHEKERFVQRGGVFGLDDVVGDFDASGVESLREIAGMIRTQAREGVRSAMALAGSAAQSKFQLFPGDCDFFERVHIVAPTREDAVEVLAATMIESVARTFTNPHLQFVEMKLGLYPSAYSRQQEPVSQGAPISWGLGGDRRAGGARGRPDRRDATGCGCTRSPWTPVSSSWTGSSLTATATAWCRCRRSSTRPGRHPTVRWWRSTACSTASTRRSTSTRTARSTSNAWCSTSRPTGWRTTSTRSGGEIAKYSAEGHENYGKVAKRLYNITRILRRDADASYLRQLFDDPPARLYQVGGTMHALSEAIRADRLDRETIVAQLAALEGTIADCYTGEDREEIIDLVRRLPEMDEDELLAAADRIAAASNTQVSGYFQQKIAESPGLKTVYDLVLKEARGASE